MMSFHQIIPSFVIVLFASTSIKNKSCVHFANFWVHSRFLMGSMLLIFLFFCVLFSSFCVCVQSCKCLWIVHSWLSFDFLKRLNTTDQSHSLFHTRLISVKISCSTIVALNTITWQHETQNVNTHNSTKQKLKRWATRTTPKNPGMNSCAYEGSCFL